MGLKKAAISQSADTSNGDMERGPVKSPGRQASVDGSGSSSLPSHKNQKPVKR